MELPYFFDQTIPQVNQAFGLSSTTHKHCAQVLRMKAGEKILLTNGQGLSATAIITDTNKKNTYAMITKVEQHSPRTKKVSIGLSLLKNTNRLEWFLEKVTESGVYEIIPLLTTRTEKQHLRNERMERIVIAAMLQSKQCWLPILHNPTAFKNIVEYTKTCKLIAHCLEGEKKSIETFSNEKEILILIGPEGDFTAEEINLAIQHQFVPVSLGNTRLSTETAGIVAATLSILNQ
jgi:16S rRNA (uracil1498-N3)-methyltransferase